MRRHRIRIETILNGFTLLVLAVAVALLVRDRVLPAVRERSLLDPGDRLPLGLVLRDISSGDSIELSDLAPVTVFVFLSSCPTCGQATPAWRAALNSAKRSNQRRFAAVTLGEPTDAREWAASELPGVRVLEPVSRSRFISLLRIDAVPTVLVVGDDGRLMERREGILEPDEARALLDDASSRRRRSGD
jgi:hypothetical protein